MHCQNDMCGLIVWGTTRTHSATRVSQMLTTLHLFLRTCLPLVLRMHESRYLELRSTAKPLILPLLLTTVFLTPLSNAYVSTCDSVVKYSLFSTGSWISCLIYLPAANIIGDILYTFADNLSFPFHSTPSIRFPLVTINTELTSHNFTSQS